MRALRSILAALFASGCVVPLVGAPCDSDDNCPNGQVCSNKTCQAGVASSGDGGAPQDGGALGDGGVAPGDAGAPDAGCVSDPACATLGQLACDPLGSNKIGTCQDLGGGCLKVRFLGNCPSPSEQTCPVGATACKCNSDCGAGDTRCSGNALLTCQVNGGGVCGVFSSPVTCSTGLSCTSAPGKPAQCSCLAASPAMTVFVDATNSTASLIPTGAHDPAGCRFARVADALATGATTVAVMGAANVYPPWRASATVPIDTKITPQVLNGHVYGCTQAGTTGTSEPAWPTSGATDIKDGTAHWKLAPDVETHVTFDKETFPLSVPTSGTLTSVECLQSLVPGCDARAYTLTVNDAALATAAVALAAGSTLDGVTVLASGSPADAPMVSCDDGAATVKDSYLSGGATSTAKVGFLVGAKCNGILERTYVHNFSSAGMDLRATAASANSEVRSSVFSVCSTGVTVESGSLDLTMTVPSVPPYFIANGSALVVDGTGSAASAIDLHDGLITQSGGDAVVLRGSKAKATLTNTTIGSSGRTASGAAVLASAGALFLTGCTLGQSNGDGVRVADATAKISSTVLAQNSGSGLVLVGAGVVTLSGATLRANSASGIDVSSGQLTLDSASAVTSNLADGIVLRGGILMLDGAAGTVSVDTNTGNGVTVTGGQLTAKSALVTGNLGVGVSLSSSAGVITALLDKTTISESGDSGVFVQKNGVHAISLTMTGCKVLKNVGTAPGGAGVRIRSDLTLVFTGNVLLGNGVSQLAFELPTTGAHLTASIGGNGCGNLANQLGCYVSKPAAGLTVSGAVTLDATNVIWESAAPQSPGDYVKDGTATLDVSSPCPVPSGTVCP